MIDHSTTPSTEPLKAPVAPPIPEPAHRRPVLDLTPASTQYTDPDIDRTIACIPLTDCTAPARPPSPLLAPPSASMSTPAPARAMDRSATNLTLPSDQAPAWFTASNANIHTTLQSILQRLDKQEDRLYLLEQPSTDIKHAKPVAHVKPVELHTPRIDDEVNPVVHWVDDPMTEDTEDLYGTESVLAKFNLPSDFDLNMDAAPPGLMEALRELPPLAAPGSL